MQATLRLSFGKVRISVLVNACACALSWPTLQSVVWIQPFPLAHFSFKRRKKAPAIWRQKLNLLGVCPLESEVCLSCYCYRSFFLPVLPVFREVFLLFLFLLPSRGFTVSTGKKTAAVAALEDVLEKFLKLSLRKPVDGGHHRRWIS